MQSTATDRFFQAALIAPEHFWRSAPGRAGKWEEAGAGAGAEMGAGAGARVRSGPGIGGSGERMHSCAYGDDGGATTAVNGTQGDAAFGSSLFGVLEDVQSWHSGCVRIYLDSQACDVDEQGKCMSTPTASAAASTEGGN